jgi:hypothetical protein
MGTGSGISRGRIDCLIFAEGRWHEKDICCSAIVSLNSHSPGKAHHMDIDEYDANGHTPLMRATIDGDYDEVKRLLDLGADPNKCDAEWNATKAEDFAGRKSKDSRIHKRIEELLIESNPHSDKRRNTESRYKFITDSEGD